jgi:hypothetical protein
MKAQDRKGMTGTIAERYEANRETWVTFGTEALIMAPWKERHASKIVAPKEAVFPLEKR